MTTPQEARPELPRRPYALAKAAADLAVGMLDRAAAAQGVEELPSSELKVGMPVAAAGGPGASTLEPFGSGGGGATYLLVHVLPVSCRVVRGDAGWRVELDDMVAAYVASGALREFAVG